MTSNTCPLKSLYSASSCRLLLINRLITCNRLSCQDALIHKLRSARLPPRSPKADPDHLLANAQEEPRAALICGWWLQRGLQSIARAQRPSASAARNRNKGKTLGGERGRNRTFNLLIKSQPVLCRQFSRNHPIHQQLTSSLARTENPLEVLETLEMFRNVQPQLQPHPKLSTPICIFATPGYFFIFVEARRLGESSRRSVA